MPALSQSPLEIVKKVAIFYQVPSDELVFTDARGSSRITQVRSVAFYLCRELTGFSYPEIQKRLEVTHHTTVFRACVRVAAKCESDPEFAAEVAACKKMVEETE